MQHHIVGLVGKRAQYVTLGRAGLVQQCQRLVGVRCQHDLVEGQLAAVGHFQYHLGGLPVQAPHRDTGEDALLETLAQGAQVFARAALNHPPLGPVVDRQQAVVAEKAQEKAQGKIEDGSAVGGPDGRSHGREVLPLEGLAVAVPPQILSQGLAVADATGVQVSHGFPVEAHDVPDHGHESPGQQVAALGEQGIEIGAGVFQPGLLVADAEAHGGGFAAHAQAVQQGNELRIGPVIEDNKAGIDGVAAGP